MKYTEEQISYIEEATRNQSSSSSWFEQRLGRITGSIFYDACHTSLEKPSKTFVSPYSQGSRSLQIGPTNLDKDKKKTISTHLKKQQFHQHMCGLGLVTDSGCLSLVLKGAQHSTFPHMSSLDAIHIFYPFLTHSEGKISMVEAA